MAAIKMHGLTVLTVITLGGGCITTFEGSNVEIDLVSQFPVQASQYGTVKPGELEPNSHFSLYAISEKADGTGQQLYELQRFEIHRLVDLDSPCFIDVGPHVPHPGLHVSQFQNQIQIDTGITDIANPPATATEDQKIEMATAIQRMQNITAFAGPMGIKVVSSASEATYPQVAADCNGSSDQIPPPSCTDATSNARRLNLCQAAWAADKNYYEGTDRIITAALDGVTYGLVDGLNPTNLSPVGGAGFFVDEAVAGSTAYAIYHVVDQAPLPGTLMLYGEPTEPTRGVLHVHMVDPGNPQLSADVAIFANIGNDDVHF